MKIKNRKRTMQICLVVIAFAILASTVTIFSDAKAIGGTAGSVTGTIVGTFTGTFDGFTKGREAGKQSGLDADDTQVKIDSIQSMGVIEVLGINFTEYNAETIGGEEKDGIKAVNPDYALLYSKTGKAVFSIDLSIAKVEIDENNSDALRVFLPKIEVKARTDDGSINEIDKYIKSGYKGSTLDGVVAYKNSSSKLKKKTSEAFEENSTFMMLAQNSAKKQVKTLVESLTGKVVSEVLIKGIDYE